MAIEQVLYNVSGNINLASVDIDDLLNIANEFPYFAPAQYLLALKQKEQNSYSFNYQLQKTALHFSNPLWLQYQLHNETIAEPVLDKIVLNGNSKLFQPTILPVEPPVFTMPVAQQPIILPKVVEPQETVTKVITPEIIVDTKPEEFKSTAPIFQQPANDGGVVDYSAYALSNSLKESLPVVTVTELEKPAETNQPPTEQTNFTNTAINYNVPTLEAVKQLLESNSGRNYNPIVENNQDPVEKNTSSTIPNYNFSGFSNQVSDTTTEMSDNAVSLSEAYSEDDIIEEEEEKNKTNNIASILSNQMADFRKPVDEDAKLDFEKEPFYTVDYFASQGIKIDLTKQPQDKLTLQLRRFTDWLKQVKGQSPNPQDLGTDPELEKAIANIAKTSIAAREIVTETMADVFIKQGKVDKAIQLYIKLSFLDPHKSAYFAHRIQQLKGI
jgi:hypothetical protein